MIEYLNEYFSDNWGWYVGYAVMFGLMYLYSSVKSADIDRWKAKSDV